MICQWQRQIETARWIVETKRRYVMSEEIQRGNRKEMNSEALSTKSVI